MSGTTRYVVTGANRGLGLELTRQILAKPNTVVVATSRSATGHGPLKDLQGVNAARLHVVTLDVSDEASVQAAVKATEQALQGHGVDVLINNAGRAEPLKRATETSVKDVRDTLETNLVGVFAVTKYFVPLLKKGQRKVIANMSSFLGSLTLQAQALHGEGDSGFAAVWPGYRASKAGLNMLTTVFANELKDQGFIVVSVNPGWVATDMGTTAGKEMGTGAKPDLDAPTAMAGILKVVEGLKPEQNGKFFDWENGKEMPW